MTMPVGPPPEGAWVIGTDFSQGETEESFIAARKAPTLAKFTALQNKLHQTYNTPLAELKDIVAAEKVTPLYVGAGHQDLASFPRCLLVPTATPGPVGSLWDLDNFRVVTRFPQYNPGGGVVDFVPILVDRTIKINKFKFITGTDTIWNGTTEHYLGLYGFDPNSSSLLKLWDSGNIVGGGSLNSTTEYAKDMGFNDTQETTPGQILFAAQLQKVGIGTTRNIAAIHQAGVTPTGGGPVKALSYYITGQTSLLSAYPLSSLSMNNTLLIWSAVSP